MGRLLEAAPLYQAKTRTVLKEGGHPKQQLCTNGAGLKGS